MTTYRILGLLTVAEKLLKALCGVCNQFFLATVSYENSTQYRGVNIST